MLGNDVIQEYIYLYKNKLLQGLQQQFILEALTAKKVMNKILNDPNASDRDRIIVVRDFLDRAGFKPIEIRKLSGTNGNDLKIVFVNPK